MRQIDCTHVLTGKTVANHQTIDIDGERIVLLRAGSGVSKPRLLAMPAPVNAHETRSGSGLDDDYLRR